MMQWKERLRGNEEKKPTEGTAEIRKECQTDRQNRKQP